MNREFREGLSLTNTRDKSIADQKWVMSKLTPEERHEIKLQCMSTRYQQGGQHWNPDTGEICELPPLRTNSNNKDKNGADIQVYDSIKLKDAIKYIIKQRYTIKSKQSPIEYFKSGQSSEGYEYYEMLAEKTIQTAYRTIPFVKSFFQIETPSRERLGQLIEFQITRSVAISEQQIDTCLKLLLVPDIEIARTKERENI